MPSAVTKLAAADRLPETSITSDPGSRDSTSVNFITVVGRASPTFHGTNVKFLPSCFFETRRRLPAPTNQEPSALGTNVEFLPPKHEEFWNYCTVYIGEQ